MRGWKIFRTAPALLAAWLPAAAAQDAATHPLLTAVCRNDFAATAGLSPEKLALDAILAGGTARKIRALDLAVANGYWEVASLLMNSGASVSNNTLSLACNLEQAQKLCARNPRWRHHRTCRNAEDPSRWAKNCRSPERYCRKILQQ